ncbi:MAG TPA: metallophosphoesterase, partial [Catenuloplanes sp.]
GAATVGVELDGVLLAGDLVNVPDRASDWFDSAAGPAFFATMTGRAHGQVAGHTWRGAPLLQHTPLFPVIGNHEVMGRWSDTATLTEQFHDTRPDDWDVTTYEELFPLPASPAGGPRWWSRTIGDVHVIALFATRMWQSDERTFQETPADLAHPRRWGRGQFPFAPLGPDSAQYRWLERELAAPACRAARLRVVMFHHPSHGLGRHSAPAYTDPVSTVGHDPHNGAVTSVRYDYPLAADVILVHLEPLLSRAGVHLVLNGHSHVWNRFRNSAGVHWLETSNVGNSYGAYHRSSGLTRPVPPGPDYPPQGDPGGLDPIVPTVAPLTDTAGTPLPYLSSNTITAFSILDSAAAVVRSYRFDTTRPESDAVLFDEFSLR